MNSSMALPRTPRSEDGFALIEVIVSAAVLALVALAVLSGIDASAGSSAREKARSVASSLAEQDQEAMRAMTVDQLLALSGSRSVPVDGVTYTVTSKAEWMTDDQGGTPSCGQTSNRSQYMHITTTVTSAITGGGKTARWTVPAVKIDSLVAPSVAYSQTHGSLGVQIVDRNDNPVVGVAVAASGASALVSQSTDQYGCVVWYSVPIGKYTVSVNRPGWGTTDGTPMPPTLTRQQTVSPNTVSFVNLKIDQLLTAKVNVYTHTPGLPFSSSPKMASAARTVSDVSALSGDGIKRTWNGGTSVVTASNLFPFPKTSYSFFTGSCDYESPFQSVAGYSNPNAVLIADPTKVLSATVYQPPVNIHVLRTSGSSATLPTNGQIKIYLTPVVPSTSDCADEAPFVFYTATWPAALGGTPDGQASQGWASQSASSFDPGLPFGTYKVCLLDTSSNKYYKPADYTNLTASGPATTVPYDIGKNSWIAGTASSCG
jgi:type II secretory pathway pseudopilin PulG